MKKSFLILGTSFIIFSSLSILFASDNTEMDDKRLKINNSWSFLDEDSSKNSAEKNNAETYIDAEIAKRNFLNSNGKLKENDNQRSSNVKQVPSKKDHWKFLDDSSEDGDDRLLPSQLREMNQSNTSRIVQGEHEELNLLKTLPKAGSTAPVSKKTAFFEKQIQNQEDTPLSPRRYPKSKNNITNSKISQFEYLNQKGSH